MRFWLQSVADRVRDALGFLAAERGYRLVAASTAGMGGGVAYRSDALWIRAEWDRSEPYLTFTPVGTTAWVTWDVLDALLRGAAHYEGLAVPQRTAPPAALAAWLRAHLDAIEAGFRPEARAATLARLGQYDAERGAEVRRWLDEMFPPRSRPAGAGPRAP